jgi:hypothetical protein
MNNRVETNHQLPLWQTEQSEETIPSPVILTNEQQQELTAALAELLLLNLPKPPDVEKGEHDAE